MAQVATAALRVMHYRTPTGAWHFDDLPGLEQTGNDGKNICEAGCYQCLLSYFNQPDHDHINRRNPEALQLLVAQANAQVLPALQTPTVVSTTSIPLSGTGGDIFSAWQQALVQGNYRQPDAVQISVAGGAATAAAQYKAEPTLVFLESVLADVRTALQDKAWQVLDMSAPTQWPQQFAKNMRIFSRNTAAMPHLS